MRNGDAVPPQLTDSAAATLEGLRRLLLSGFTGLVEIDCAAGGVRHMTTSERKTPDQLLRDVPKSVG